MGRNPHDRILKMESKKQHLSTVSKSCFFFFLLNKKVKELAIIIVIIHARTLQSKFVK